MTDFNSYIDLSKDIITSYNKKQLIIKNPYIYNGPITMQ